MGRERRGGSSQHISQETEPPEYCMVDGGGSAQYRTGAGHSAPSSRHSTTASRHKQPKPAVEKTPEYASIEDLRSGGGGRGEETPPPPPPHAGHHHHLAGAGDAAINPLFRHLVASGQWPHDDRSFLTLPARIPGPGAALAPHYPHGSVSAKSVRSLPALPPQQMAQQALHPDTISLHGGGMPTNMLDPRQVDSLDYMLSKLETRSLHDGGDGGGWGSPDAYPAGNPGGQHPYYNTVGSQRSLLSRPAPATSCAGAVPCWCRAVLAVLGVLLVAWGVAVPLYFVFGPGLPGLRGEALITPPPPAAPAAAQEMDAETRTHLLTMNGTVLTAVNCSMRIVNQRYSHFLSSPFSAEYQALKLKLETLLAIIFQQNKSFNKASMSSFRHGEGNGVIADFVLMFNEKRSDIREYSHNVLNNYLMQHWTMIGSYQIEVNSLKVEYIQNQCSVNNGGCSHLCFWSVLSVGYECHCPQHHTLMADQRTCYPAAIEREVTTTINPCGDDHFLCRSGGNCIPGAWLCDGVSDCLLGEDEAKHMCKLVDKTKKAKVDKTGEKSAAAAAASSSPPPDPAMPTSSTQEPTTTPFFIWHNEVEATTKDFAIPSLAPDDNQSMIRGRKPDQTARQYKFFG